MPTVWFRTPTSALLLSAFALASFSTQVQAYGQNTGADLVIDAPWRTIRNYLPVLFFLPDPASSDAELIEIALYNLSADGKNKELIFRDRGIAPGSRSKQYLGCKTQSGHSGVKFIDSLGKARADVSKDNAKLKRSWHYIARVPIQCLGLAGSLGKPGVHHIEGHFKIRRNFSARDPKKPIETRPDRPGTGGPEYIDTSARKVMRVVVTNQPFPKFAAQDRYYDIHFHSFAEQTSRQTSVGAGDVASGSERDREVDVAKKVFGGPVAMVLESAYTLGLVNVQLKNANWSAFRDKLAFTDHNVFFSKEPYDSPSAPGDGPTANTDGAAGEFGWYRKAFGVLAGEEITLRETPQHRRPQTAWFGHHYLFYGGKHFDGPWHGGKIILEGGGLSGTSKLQNHNALTHVHKNASLNAFGYAAHPFVNGDGWTKELLDQAIGFNQSQTKGPVADGLTTTQRSDFIFKGLQIWNEDHIWTALGNVQGKSMDVDGLHNLDPFTGSRPEQQNALTRGRHLGLIAARDEYFQLLRQGLRFAFKDAPRDGFIRKLYMAAGTDAHGDFNYLINTGSVFQASAGNIGDLPVISHFSSSEEWDNTMKITGNAFGRVRTYTLTSEGRARATKSKGSRRAQLTSAGRLNSNSVTATTLSSTKKGAPKRKTVPKLVATKLTDGSRESVQAYREGNTVLTNGPLCRFSVDTQCRFNSGKDQQGWHDDVCSYENNNGQIGGSGKFDGGKTGLYVDSDKSLLFKQQWQPSANTGPVSRQHHMDYQLHHIASVGGVAVTKWTQPPSKGPKVRPLRLRFPTTANPQALTLVGQWKQINKNNLAILSGQCLTNPVWLAPVRIEIEQPPGCPMTQNRLKVHLKFPFTMFKGPGMRVHLAPLDAKGRAGPAKLLKLAGKWRGSKTMDHVEATFLNSETVSCPAEGWNARQHKPAGRTIKGFQGAHSFVVTISGLRDVHGNRLNSLGKTFLYEYGVKHGTGTTGTLSN